MHDLPNYLRGAKPTPKGERGPWYKNTAPAYAGIFLWFGFYVALATNTLPQAGLLLSLLGLVCGAAICYLLFFLVPGLLGMRTGYPLYVVGTSTYGTHGGFLIPALLMGLLQFGWISVNIAISTDFAILAAGVESKEEVALAVKTPLWIAFAVLWAALVGLVGFKGIAYVSKVATWLPLACLIMLSVVFVTNVGHAAEFEAVPDAKPLMGFLTIITVVVGFFATAGAAGADIGMGNRNSKDVVIGGLVGVAGVAILVGALVLVATAGASVISGGLEDFKFDSVIKQQGPFWARGMFVVFVIESFPPACFSAFLTVNFVRTLAPNANKVVVVCLGLAVAVILAVTGVSKNLIGFFVIVGASFGPICGAMVADFLLSGRKWPGPRRGVNLAGYISWAVGFTVGILPLVAGERFAWITPAPVIAFVIGFVVYVLCAKIGLEPEVVSIASPEEPETESPPGAPASRSQH